MIWLRGTPLAFLFIASTLPSARGQPDDFSLGRMVVEDASLVGQAYSCQNVISSSPRQAKSQRRRSPRLWLRGGFGYSRLYLDEPAFVTYFGALRFDVREGFWVEPEFSWFTGERFAGRGFEVNLGHNFSGAGSRLVWYGVFGGGAYWELDKAIDYRRVEASLSAGLGLRIRLLEQVALSTELKLGTQKLPRLGLSLDFGIK